MELTFSIVVHLKLSKCWPETAVGVHKNASLDFPASKSAGEFDDAAVRHFSGLWLATDKKIGGNDSSA